MSKPRGVCSIQDHVTLLVTSFSLKHLLPLVSMTSHDSPGLNPPSVTLPSLCSLQTHSLPHDHEMMGPLRLNCVLSPLILCPLSFNNLNHAPGLSHEPTPEAGRDRDLIMGEGNCFPGDGGKWGYCYRKKKKRMLENRKNKNPKDGHRAMHSG